LWASKTGTIRPTESFTCDVGRRGVSGQPRVEEFTALLLNFLEREFWTWIASVRGILNVPFVWQPKLCPRYRVPLNPDREELVRDEGSIPGCAFLRHARIHNRSQQ